MKDFFSLAGKVALVTGGGDGLGQGIALAFADYGADVAVTALHLEKATATAKQIKAKGRKALPLASDAMDGKQADQMVNKVVDVFGKIDILVNNAGGLKAYRAVLDMTEEEWDFHIAWNLKSVFLGCKAVGRVMVERGIKGSIINMSSIHGFSGRATTLHYGSAKAAIRLFTDGLAKEWAQYGIRVNALAPSNINTPMVARVYKDKPELLQQRTRMCPMGRMGEIWEVGSVAVFLASDASNYITGQTILISGGRDTTLEPREFYQATPAQEGKK